jgi:flagellar protein FlgJ
MIESANLSGNMALDANGLNDLRRAAKDNSPEAIKATARQFEAMFMNMMLKSMRDATPQDGPLDSEQSRSFTAMLDQQLSQNLANRGVGLAEVLVKQLSKTASIAPESTASNPPVTAKPTSVDQIARYQAVAAMNQNKLTEISASNTENQPNTQLEMSMANIDPDNKTPRNESIGNSSSGSTLTQTKKAFQQNMASAAQEASIASGIPTQYLIGQAALESGWGKREIKGQDGTNSFNLFGIKATGDWKGKVVSATTTEYINGEKQQRVEKFRAYDSYAESFKDFTKLIRNNPRYDNVIGNGQNPAEYAQALQKGGYATDPQYANKLTQLIQLASAG